jgi:hypothetical protein
LIHLILSANLTSQLVPILLSNLATPPSFPQGPSTAVAVLASIFNLVPDYPDLQFQIFKIILSISQEHNLYDYVSPYFKNLNDLLKEWNVPEGEAAQVWATVISMAEKAEDK